MRADIRPSQMDDVLESFKSFMQRKLDLPADTIDEIFTLDVPVIYNLQEDIDNEHTRIVSAY